MNRTVIAVTTIIAIAAAAIFGLHSLTQATTAVDPVTPDDADVNWDGRINSIDQLWLAKKYGQAVDQSGRPVREQNVDANGNIKVALPGPVDVNLVPAAQQNYEFTAVVVDCNNGSAGSVQIAATSAITLLNALGADSWNLVGTPDVLIATDSSGSTARCTMTYTLERPLGVGTPLPPATVTPVPPTSTPTAPIGQSTHG